MAKILEKYQSKSITPVDEYVCTLSEETQKQAETELGETPEAREKALKEMREWAFNNPRIIKCRLDSSFLLRFIRCHKYSMEHAKESFERYLILREGLYGYDWFTNIDSKRPGVREFLDKGLFVILPNRAPSGEVIILVRCSACDPKFKDAGNVAFSLSTMIMETIFNTEENQVRGYRIIMDMAEIRLAHYFMFSFGTWFRIMKHVERTFTGRHRSCHIINLSPTLSFIVKLAFKHMKERQKSYVSFPSGPEEIDYLDIRDLPTEYGGQHSIEDLIDPWRKKLEASHDFFLKYSEMKVNYKYYTQAVLKCDVSTLNHKLENKDAKLLKKVADVNDNNENDDSDFD